MFQTKDMEYVNVSLPWMPDRTAMILQLVEKQLKTEQVCHYLHSLPYRCLNIHLHIGVIQQYFNKTTRMSNNVEQEL